MQGTRGYLDESYILVIAREVAKGLKAIHDCGIIHRDLKGETYHQSSSLIRVVSRCYSYMGPEADSSCLLQLPISWCMKKAESRSLILVFLD